MSALYPCFALAGGLLGALSLGFWPGRRAAGARLWACASAAAALLLLLAFFSERGAFELWRRDGFSESWTALFLLAAFPLLAAMRPRSEVQPALALGMLLGLCLLACANHLFALFLGLELLSLPAYLLLYSLRKDRRSLEAAVKYFFCGAMASGLYLFGMALYYAWTGTLSLTPQALQSPVSPLAATFMTCAALFKIGAFPLHFWLPDVYESAEPELAGFFSTAVKAAGVLLLMRLIPLIPPGQALSPAFWLPALSAATMLFGNLLAFRQSSLQRLLAYSSLAHAGYLLAAVWAWSKLGDSAASVLLYLAAYLFMNGGAFLFLRASGLRRWEDLRGYGAREPGLAAFFALMLLGLGGVPPTGGFPAKLFVFMDILRAGGVWLAVLMALNSAIALGYYLLAVRAMVFEPAPGSGAPGARPEPAGVRLCLAACAAMTLLLGVWPGARSLLELVLP